MLSHHDVPGVARERQGVTRAITPSGLLHLAVARALIEGVRTPIGHALGLAGVLLGGQGHDTVVGPGVRLSLDRAALERRIQDRLLVAVESAPTRRRGRPPRRAP